MINISAGDQQRINDYVARFEQMNDAEVRARHEEIVAKTEAEYAEFVRMFDQGDCYLCHHPFASFSTERPCLHWLLKPKGFKKKHIVEVANRFDFFQLQSYLRWVANQQAFATNINDLSEEGTGGKLVELTTDIRTSNGLCPAGRQTFVGMCTLKTRIFLTITYRCVWMIGPSSTSTIITCAFLSKTLLASRQNAACRTRFVISFPLAGE